LTASVPFIPAATPCNLLPLKLTVELPVVEPIFTAEPLLVPMFVVAPRMLLVDSALPMLFVVAAVAPAAFKVPILFVLP